MLFPSRRKWLFWLSTALILATTSACRVEISLGEAAAASAKVLATPVVAKHVPPTEPSSPSPVSLTATPSPVPASPTLAPTATPTPINPTPSPTATPQPIIPAQTSPTHILAPAINLAAPVEVAGWTVVKKDGSEISNWLVPDGAAGWHQNSALPGHGGNVVLSGHHNMGAEVFRYLVDLKKGDDIILQADGRDYHYFVTEHFILPERGVSEEQRRQNAQWIMPTSEERLTLVTCWPYNDNSHRLIVVAKMTNN
ncbi:MAG: sortase [Anaerolineae bacterium]